MDESQKTLQRLERLRQLNTDRNWINANLYRLMYKEDVYILAYERIKSAPGNMTPGTDGKTIDGISMRMIQNIIQEMRTEQFQSFVPAARFQNFIAVLFKQHLPANESIPMVIDAENCS